MMLSSTPQLPWVLIFFVIVFTLREYFAFKEHLNGKYFLTPLVTLSSIGVVLIAIGSYGFDAYRVFVLIALLCALVADTMLMVVEVDLLHFGLVYFLLGHLCYIIAFSYDFFFLPWNGLFGAVVALLLFLFFRKIRGTLGRLSIPVVVYLVVISSMVFFAGARLNDGFERDRICSVLGALLFVISDIVLATNKFLKENPHSTVITWSLYAPGQMLIALSCFK